MGIYDVPADRLIEAVANELKTKIQQPEFTKYIKTGAHRERAPQRSDWFFMRNASILYQLYRHGATGTGSLRTYYGGRRNRGVKPEHKKKASGKIIRVCLQNLEKQGLLKKDKKGRAVTGKGEKLLYAKAKEIEIIFKEEIKKQEEEKVQRMEKAKQNIEKAMKERKEKEEKLKQKKEAELKAKEETKEQPKSDENERRGKPEAKKA
ncbi:MAG TPA: 30S ribosomal protein S19e [archaeon]|nr:30S ribosomal protein S19e [archaeon]